MYPVHWFCAKKLTFSFFFLKGHLLGKKTCILGVFLFLFFFLSNIYWENLGSFPQKIQMYLMKIRKLQGFGTELSLNMFWCER